jgi:hypothetical protein
MLNLFVVQLTSKVNDVAVDLEVDWINSRYNVFGKE